MRIRSMVAAMAVHAVAAQTNTTSRYCASQGTSADGYCDDWDSAGGANSAACDWDGGDCCESTCLSTTSYTCGVMGYFCKDPNATDVGFETLACDFHASFLGDGWCDSEDHNLFGLLSNGLGVTNTAACNWDGGDCCESTCVDGDDYTCGTSDYTCLDPAAFNTSVTATVSAAVAVAVLFGAAAQAQ